MRGSISLAFMGLMIFIGGTILFGTFYTVDEGERVVLLRNGAVASVEGPGWHFKLPIIEDTVDMSVRTERRQYDLSAYSKDVQNAKLQVVVNYHLDPSALQEIYTKYGEEYVTRLLDPAVYARAKVAFGQYTATKSIAERAQLTADMETAIKDGIVNPAVVVEEVQITEITFSDDFNKAVEARMQAEIEVEKLRQNLEREKVQADIVRTQANAQADAKRADADAKAYSIKAEAEAQAQGIEKRGEALRKNPNLVSLVTAESWDGKLPSTMLPGSTVPFVNVGQ